MKVEREPKADEKSKSYRMIVLGIDHRRSEGGKTKTKLNEREREVEADSESVKSWMAAS